MPAPAPCPTDDSAEVTRSQRRRRPGPAIFPDNGLVEAARPPNQTGYSRTSTSSDARPMTDELPRIFGKYLLERRLGVGGMAETFVARREGAGGIVQHVCIKRVLPAFHKDPEFIQQFQREARLAAKLRHQNIVQVLDFGYVGETLYMALELVRGVDLRDFLRAQPDQKLAIEFVGLIAHDMIYALDYAHRPHDGVDGIVHRDVTPSNVLLSRNGHAKLADFGVAKAIGTSTVATATGVMKGKMPYMPAEQMKGGAIDGRTDLFSLGVVLYEALAGRRPFVGAHDVEVMTKIVTNTRPKLIEVAPHVPAELCAVVEKLLGPEPEDRFENADAVLDAIAPFVPPPSYRRRLADMVRDCYGDTERGPEERDTRMADIAELPANVPGALQVAVPSEAPVDAGGPTALAPSQPPPAGDGATRMVPSELPPAGRAATLYGMGPASDRPPPEDKSTHLDLAAQARAAAAQGAVQGSAVNESANAPAPPSSSAMMVPPAPDPIDRQSAEIEVPALEAPPHVPNPPPTGSKRGLVLAAVAVLAVLGIGGVIFALQSDPAPVLPPEAVSATLPPPTPTGPTATERAAPTPTPAEATATQAASGDVAAEAGAAGQDADRSEDDADPRPEDPAPAAVAQAAMQEAAMREGAMQEAAAMREAAANAADEDEDEAPRLVAVTVACLPWGEVWVGDRYMGRAPVQLRLPPGSHTIRAGTGSPQFSKTVRVRAGRRRQTVEFDLDALMQARAEMR